MTATTIRDKREADLVSWLRSEITAHCTARGTRPGCSCCRELLGRPLGQFLLDCEYVQNELAAYRRRRQQEEATTHGDDRR